MTGAGKEYCCMSPTSSDEIWRYIIENFGFFTREHHEAIRDFWFALCTIVPSMLWLHRNETIHEGQLLTATEVKDRIPAAALKQIRGIAEHRRRTAGRRMAGVCLQQCIDAFENQDPDPQHQPRQRLTIHFDGGARGNPGPGGSGWAISQTTQGLSRLIMCGSTYGGSYSTNNKCELQGLQRELAVAKRLVGRGSTDLEVVGDSRIIIASHQGVATISHHSLRDLVSSVNDLLWHFGLVHWRHVYRRHNKMADGLANHAMASRTTTSFSSSSTSVTATKLFRTTAELLSKDLRNPSHAPRTSKSHSTITSAR